MLVGDAIEFDESTAPESVRALSLSSSAPVAPPSPSPAAAAAAAAGSVPALVVAGGAAVATADGSAVEYGDANCPL